MNDVTHADYSMLLNAARLFRHGMCNKDVLLLYDINGSCLLEGFEFKFFDYNFFHLLGLKYTTGFKYAKLSKIDANREFLKDLLNTKLDINSIEFRQYKDKQKLQVITAAVGLNNVKLTGEYTYKGVYLNAEWAYGNSNYTLAIQQKLDNNGKLLYYYPISLLQQSLSVTAKPVFTVQAIFCKDFKYNNYTRCLYCTNNYGKNYAQYSYNINIRNKLDSTQFYFLTPAQAMRGKTK